MEIPVVHPNGEREIIEIKPHADIIICKHGNQVLQMGPQCQECQKDSHALVDAAIERVKQDMGYYIRWDK